MGTDLTVYIVNARVQLKCIAWHSTKVSGSVIPVRHKQIAFASGQITQGTPTIHQLLHVQTIQFPLSHTAECLRKPMTVPLSVSILILNGPTSGTSSISATTPPISSHSLSTNCKGSSRCTSILPSTNSLNPTPDSATDDPATCWTPATNSSACALHHQQTIQHPARQ